METVGAERMDVDQLYRIQEISDTTHVSRTPQNPEYLLARSQLLRGPLLRSHSNFDEYDHLLRLHACNSYWHILMGLNELKQAV